MSEGRARESAAKKLSACRDQMQIPPLLDRVLKSSAKVGNLFVPATMLESYLGRFASHLMTWNGDETHKVSLVGSATCVRFRGHCFLISSNHQVENINHETVCMMLSDGSYAVTCSGSRTFNASVNRSDSDVYDVAAFEFTEPVEEHPELAERFFDFSTLPPDTQNRRIVAFILVGFPSAEQKYELEEANHLGSVKRILLAQPGSQPADEALLRVCFEPPLDFDPDGLSGGPAFVVQEVAGEFRVFLAGILLRAGRNEAYLLKVGYLESFLGSFVRDS